MPSLSKHLIRWVNRFKRETEVAHARAKHRITATETLLPSDLDTLDDIGTRVPLLRRCAPHMPLRHKRVFFANVGIPATAFRHEERLATVHASYAPSLSAAPQCPSSETTEGLSQPTEHVLRSPLVDRHPFLCRLVPVCLQCQRSRAHGERARREV